MSEAKYDIFVKNLSELSEDQDVVISIRDLTPGIYKYMHKYVKARLSSSPSRYPDELAIRLGRGQLYGGRYSIQILKELQRVPEEDD